MTIPKKFVHDKTVLLLLAANATLLLVGLLLVLFKMDAGRGNGYIIQYRSSIGLGDFRPGTAFDMLSFVFFMVGTSILNVLLSIRVFALRRNLSVAILGMGVLLLLLSIIVSNALLALR